MPICENFYRESPDFNEKDKLKVISKFIVFITSMTADRTKQNQNMSRHNFIL